MFLGKKQRIPWKIGVWTSRPKHLSVCTTILKLLKKSIDIIAKLAMTQQREKIRQSNSLFPVVPWVWATNNHFSFFWLNLNSWTFTKYINMRMKTFQKKKFNIRKVNSARKEFNCFQRNRGEYYTCILPKNVTRKYWNVTQQGLSAKRCSMDTNLNGISKDRIKWFKKIHGE